MLGFDTTPSDEVLVPGGLFQVFEHPKRDRIMTKPSGGGILTAQSDVASPASIQAAAARRYLDGTGRSRCPITFVREISGPQYEFRFNCLPD
ncbi:hypothetical protein RB623_26270 [Mesorhizobium sp. LHD-90]|uniref:hypothetical protein n=1 Tax=Mesorhizobium sp. LHD-90 TaxID=3071414 RepID=UPI0027DEBF9A|nr:hypothetical protein [Mesorhizobium sp. LHD-90]MDQ6437573.1 hypothetical protein [Mesorhizobium sp. LHD-90]